MQGLYERVLIRVRPLHVADHQEGEGEEMTAWAYLWASDSARLIQNEDWDFDAFMTNDEASFLRGEGV